MTPLQLLTESKALIGHPSKWVIGELEDEFGRRCSLGAIRHAVQHDPLYSNVPDKTNWYEDSVSTASQYLCDAIGGEAAQAGPGYRLELIADFNDAHTHEEVMAMWDRAIELARADEEIQGISVADLIDELAPA